MKAIKSATKGFTLLELLVVVLIIGILGAIALPQYQRVVDKTKFSTLFNITRNIAEANERFYMINNRYSTNFLELDVDIPAKSVSGNRINFDWGYCQLYNQQEIVCYDMVRLKNLYTIYYQNSSAQDRRNFIMCGALTDERNSRFDKLCQSVGTYRGLGDASYNGETYPCLIYIIRK